MTMGERCGECGKVCPTPAPNPGVYVVHACGQMTTLGGPRQWCPHLGKHLPNLGLHRKGGV